MPGQHEFRVHARLFASAAARFFAAFSLEKGPSRCVVLPVEPVECGGELEASPTPAPVCTVSPEAEEEAEPSPKVAAE